MKKAISLIVGSLLFLLFSSSVFADTHSEEDTSSASISINSDYIKKSELSKKIILSRYQIKGDYSNGRELNTSIEKFFIAVKLKSSLDKKETLEKIEDRMLDILGKFNKKSILSFNETRLKNLVYNLYYRSILELEKY